MGSKGSDDAFCAFQVSSQDAWVTHDEDYLKIISKQVAEKTARHVIELHQQEMKHSKVMKPKSDANNGPRQSSLKSIRAAIPSVAYSTKHAPGMGVRLSSTPEYLLPAQQRLLDRDRIQRFSFCLSVPVADMTALRELSWYGIPSELRPTVWKLLCDYLPPSQERRDAVLLEKRRQYLNFVDQYFHLKDRPSSAPMFHQIQKDLTRMTLLHRRNEMQQMFERILFIWAMRHPGSGYVQGMNDLLTPFFLVFLAEYTRVELRVSEDTDTSVDLNTACELSLQSELNEEQLQLVESDVFWCASRLLDHIQDNYTFAQPGIQNNISMLASLLERIDRKLHEHLSSHNVEYLQFAFRWMNNLLIRELPLRCIIRLWDTYMSEKNGFSSLHVYVCAAFLLQFAGELQREPDFQGLMLLLQHLPTYHWTDDDMKLVLAEAYRLQVLFAAAPKHLVYQRHRDVQ